MKISFKNCKVYSSFIPLKIHNSIIIDNGKVKSFEDDPDAIDLNGKFIIPAFIDSHLHLDEIGLFLNTLDLRGIRSKIENFC
ncbi:MAG: amidohydrolase family protein [Thermoplasmata archaeon]